MDINERIAIEVYGWKWIAMMGIPEKGTPDYPRKQMVRRLFSPESQASEAWKRQFDECGARDADGTEPLAYCYCSSSGYQWPPDYVGILREADKIDAAIAKSGPSVELLKAIGKARRKKA